MRTYGLDELRRQFELLAAAVKTNDSATPRPFFELYSRERSLRCRHCDTAGKQLVGMRPQLAGLLRLLTPNVMQ